MSHEIQITYVGGPTALIEIAGQRLLTDPTFDPAGGVYGNLTKTMGPALSADSIGRVDAVLLSHDHHEDNLDHSGRDFLKNAGSVFTTVDGAKRLGGNTVGLAHWESAGLGSSEDMDGSALRITATPARHGPAHMDRGPVIGFLVQPKGSDRALYISGDTVWYEGVAEVAARYKVGIAVLFMGAARVERVGPFPLTMTAQDGIQAAQAFPEATIVPLHFEGWKHFFESKEDIQRRFEEAGLQQRIRWPDPGKRLSLTL